VAHGAVGQAAAIIDLILPNECLSQRRLVGRKAPVKIVNFRRGSEKILRRPMTIEAPLHVERLRPPGERHLIERSMASGAADAFGDMNAVIEIDEIGEIVHPVPFHRLASR